MWSFQVRHVGAGRTTGPAREEGFLEKKKKRKKRRLFTAGQHYCRTNTRYGTEEKVGGDEGRMQREGEGDRGVGGEVAFSWWWFVFFGFVYAQGVGPHHRTWCGGCGVRGDVGWAFARGGEVELDWGSWVG